MRKKRLGILLLMLLSIIVIEQNIVVEKDLSSNAIIENGITASDISSESIPNDINTSDKWRFEYTKMNDVWDQLDNIPYKENIVVAVIDSGIKMDHTDLNIMEGGYDFYEKDDNPWDSTGHGTHVAGIIGAKRDSGSDNVVGIAPGVKLLPLKVFSDSGNASHFAMIEAIDYSIEKKVDVINISMANVDIKEVREAVERAEAADIVVVASAGNYSNHWENSSPYHQKYSGSPSYTHDIIFPAGNMTVLAVGSVRKHPSKDEIGISDFSDVGAVIDGEYRAIDVVAPGSYIYSSSFTSTTSTRVKSGTSMAAPHVTGLVVLLRAKYPHLSAAEIRELIRETAYDPGIALPEGYTAQERIDSIGQGLIDIDAAINYSPLKSLRLFDDTDFGYEMKKYNYLLSVDPEVTSIKLKANVANGTKIFYKGIEVDNISKIDIILDKDITVFEFEVEKFGIRRKYKFFVKFDQDPNMNQITDINIATQNLNELVSESNMDYYIRFNKNVHEVFFNVLTKATNSEISLITSAGESGFIYTSGEDIKVNLIDPTEVVAIKVRNQNGVESTHMLAFIKNDQSEIVDYPIDLEAEEIIITNRVAIKLNTDAVILDYGVDADPNYTSYDFQATVSGASKSDVVWSLDNNDYVTVDSNGLVSIKENIPTNLGDFSIKLKAQSVVGGVTEFADILFVEKTPLGKIEFFAPYISGYDDGTFRPKQSITRAEVATIFSKILNLQLDNNSEMIFSDVSDNHWAYSYVNAMYATGIFTGYSDGTFKPSAPITRAEIAQVITNYWTYSDVNVNDSHVINIPDVDDELWASDAIHRLYNSRVTSGYINNAYRPYDDTTREEIVYMINKLLGRKPIENPEPKFDDIQANYFYAGDIEAASEFYINKNKINE